MATIWNAPVTEPGAADDVGIRYRQERRGYIERHTGRLVVFQGAPWPAVKGVDLYCRQWRVQWSGLRIDFATDTGPGRLAPDHNLPPAYAATWRAAIRNEPSGETWGPWALASDLDEADPYTLPLTDTDRNAILVDRQRGERWTLVLFDRPARGVTTDWRLVDVAEHSIGPDIRLAGARLAGHQLRTGTLSVEQRINQRTTCEFESLWTLTVADSHLLTEDGGRIALEDGAEFLTLELHRPRLPRFGDTLSIDLPHTSFRQRVLDRRPLVYWALDERPGRTHVRDWSGNGRCGAVSAGVLLRHRQSRDAAVPYGGAPRMNTGPISLADFPLPDECTVQVWLDLSRFKPSGTEMIIDLPGPVGVKRHLDSELRLVGPGGAEQIVSWPGGSGWHLLTVILAGRHWVVRIDDRTVVDEPLTADAGAKGTLALGFENRQSEGECECEWWIDEFSVVPYALTADEVAGDYAARAHLRVFDGVVLDPSIRGREHSGEADVRVHGAGQGMLLERAAVTHPVVTDPDASIGDTMDGLLTDRAPESGLNTDGVHFRTPAGRQVSAGRQVYALQTLYEVFRHLAETGGGNLWVAPWGEIQAVPRSDVPASGVRLDGMKCSNSESMDDSQHLRTTQVLAGAAGARGETVEWFAGDGAKKKFGPLRYPPDTVLDIRVDGASEPWTGDAPPWTVSADDFTLVRNPAPPAPGASPPGPNGTNVMVSYRSDFPIVAEVESEDGRRLYGRWVRIDEDRTADDVPLAIERARTRLDRHDTPAKRLSVTTVRGALGPLVVGGLARCHFPRLHEIDDLDMLVDTVRTCVQAGADAELVHDVELVADGYESRFLDYLREIGKITTPFRLAAGKRAEASTRHTLDPLDAGFEGVILPAALGGSDSAPNTTRGEWTPIAGGVIAQMNGRSLASLQGAMVLTFNAHVDPPAAGTCSAAVRLWNRTGGTAVEGAAVNVTRSARTLHHVPRLALSPATAEYEVQYQLIYSGSEQRRPRLWVTAATLTAGARGG